MLASTQVDLDIPPADHDPIDVSIDKIPIIFSPHGVLLNRRGCFSGRALTICVVRLIECACRLASELLDVLTPHVKPGITTREIDRLAALRQR